MPGIKQIQAGAFWLALIFLPTAVLAEPASGIQTLEWPADASQPVDETRDADVWQRIRDGFRLPEVSYPLIKVHEAWYASHPDHVRRVVERSRRYLFHIVGEVERRDMPMEIALLPIIESAFDPQAHSPSAASGIWQFISSTGRNYGLKQDHWYDGRRDITAATSAALDYLGKLYLDFGDWQLALAAYNCGEGCVARAIQRNVAKGLPTDYASLPLPTETRHYVPKLLAVKNLVLDPERFGVAIDVLPNQPYFAQITVHASMDVDSAARLAGMSYVEFTALNPAFSRNLIRSDTPVNILVPVDKTDHFEHNLQSGSWDTWKPFAAKKGERPETIAKRFGVSMARLKEHNQFHLKRGKLVRAQTILVPIKGRGVVLAKSSDPAQPADMVENLHHVKPGETLYSISHRYGLTVTDLTQANSLSTPSLQAGQVLQLPINKEADSEPDQAIRNVAFSQDIRTALRTTHYTIKRGDTLFAIAQRFAVSVSDLKSWNSILHKTSVVKAGKRIVIRGSY